MVKCDCFSENDYGSESVLSSFYVNVAKVERNFFDSNRFSRLIITGPFFGIRLIEPKLFKDLIRQDLINIEFSWIDVWVCLSIQA